MIDELGLRFRVLEKRDERDLFCPGLYSFLDYAHKYGSFEEKSAISLDPDRAWGFETNGQTYPNVHNAKTWVCTVKKRNQSKQRGDPVLLLVYPIVARSDADVVKSMKDEIFGRDTVLLKAEQEDLFPLGFWPKGCHPFPEIPTFRKVYFWIDETPKLCRFPLYHFGMDHIEGFLSIDNAIYRNLQERRFPGYVKSVKGLGM